MCDHSKSSFKSLKQYNVTRSSCVYVLQVTFQLPETMSCDWMFLCVHTPSHVSAFWNNGTWLGHLVCMYSKSHFSFLKQCHVIGSPCVYALQVMLQLPEKMSCDWVILRVTLQVMHVTGSPCVYARSHTSGSRNNVVRLGHPVYMYAKSHFSFLKQCHVTGSSCICTPHSRLQLSETRCCFPAQTHQKHAQSEQRINALGTTYKKILHLQCHCVVFEQNQNSKCWILIFVIESYLQGCISSFRCDVSKKNHLSYLQVKQDSELLFIKLDHMHRQKAKVHWWWEKAL